MPNVMPDVDDVAESLRSLLATNVTSFQSTHVDADERTIVFPAMPLLDVTYEDLNPEVLAGQQYYTELKLVGSIYTVNLTSFKEATTLRNSLLQSCLDTIRSNPRFHADLLSSRLGPVKFAKAQDEQTKAFVARCDFEVVTMFYNDRS
jgi:hypothetical protein